MRGSGLGFGCVTVEFVLEWMWVRGYLLRGHSHLRIGSKHTAADPLLNVQLRSQTGHHLHLFLGHIYLQHVKQW